MAQSNQLFINQGTEEERAAYTRRLIDHRRAIIQAYLVGTLSIPNSENAVLDDNEIYNTYAAHRDRQESNHWQQALSNNKKMIGYSNILESLIYLTYFIPGAGLLSVFFGYFFNNVKDGYASMATEGTTAERNSKLSQLKKICLNSLGIIALLGGALNPISAWIGIGFTAGNAFYNIYKKYSVYKAAKREVVFLHADNALESEIYIKNLDYAKSDLWNTVRNEVVKITAIVFLASIFVGLTVLTSGFFPLICIGIGSVFTAYNAYARHQQETRDKNYRAYIEILEREKDQNTVNGRITQIPPEQQPILGEQKKTIRDQLMQDIIKIDPFLEGPLTENKPEYRTAQQLEWDRAEAAQLQEQLNREMQLEGAAAAQPQGAEDTVPPPLPTTTEVLLTSEPEVEEFSTLDPLGDIERRVDDNKIHRQQLQKLAAIITDNTHLRLIRGIQEIYKIEFKKIETTTAENLQKLKEYSDKGENKGGGDHRPSQINKNLLALKCQITMDTPWDDGPLPEVDKKTENTNPILLLEYKKNGIDHHISVCYKDLLQALINPKETMNFLRLGFDIILVNGRIAFQEKNKIYEVTIQPQKKLIDETLSLIKEYEATQAPKVEVGSSAVLTEEALSAPPPPPAVLGQLSVFTLKGSATTDNRKLLPEELRKKRLEKFGTK